MKQLQIKNLCPGMTFTEDVYLDDTNLLVPADIAVRAKDITQLLSWGVETAITDGRMILPTETETAMASGGLLATIKRQLALERQAAGKTAAPPVGAVNKQADTGKQAAAEKKKTISIISLKKVEENQDAYPSYVDLIGRLDWVFEQIGIYRPVENRLIDAITSSVLQAVREQRGQIVGFILGGEVPGRELARKSINEAVLSARIAIALKLPLDKIVQIVTGALLHDVGMVRLPRTLLEKKGELTAEELGRMHAHPLASYRIISKELAYPEAVGLIAFHHHERWDGEGYPNKLAGKQIDLNARIVTVADSFEDMISEKPGRNSLVGHEVMQNLLSNRSPRFDPDAFRAFIRTMGIYPVGAIVRLDNGVIARVIEVQGYAPLRPKIKVLIDAENRVFRPNDGPVINLLQDTTRYIARALDPREIAKQGE
ncbi:metal-dependent phosphohydrolase [Spirochaetia bacterium]|nr:metal-dependent phosphohydrolase [Spirochaetia bacterium]